MPETDDDRDWNDPPSLEGDGDDRLRYQAPGLAKFVVVSNVLLAGWYAYAGDADMVAILLGANVVAAIAVAIAAVRFERAIR